ncbi:Proteasome subunit beta [Aphelenchoides bicaudatus]|nr:Proteasome subunit beta [Aphelenchoides bicaudatus]
MEECYIEKREAIPALGFYPRAPITTGTTLVAVEYADGVVIGTDSRTSSGSFVASRATDKITPVHDRLVICRSGSASDTQMIADIVRYYIEVHSTMENEPMSIYRAAQLYRKFLFDYREQLSASLILIGYDEKEGAQIYSLPPGGFVMRQNYYCSGSGGTYNMNYLDNHWKPDMSLQDAKDLVKQAVALSIHRDGASGGVIRMAVLNKDGTQREHFRQDLDQFPVFTRATIYQTLPKHIEQHPTA